MEINGTWYAKDSIKRVGKVYVYENPNRIFFSIGIYLNANSSTTEELRFDNLEEAEQSRKQLIEQLNK